MKVQFSRNTLVKGTAYAATEVADIDPKDAKVVCEMGKARAVGKGAKVGIPKKGEKVPELKAKGDGDE